MILKNFKIILILVLFYQSPSNSKSPTFGDFEYKIFSRYFSGIVALENKNNSRALNFFNSSKKLVYQHDPYLKKYVYSLVLEDKVFQAINVIKNNHGQINSQFFDAFLLLIVDSLKKDDLQQAFYYISKAMNASNQNKFDIAVLESLKQYVYTFKENKIYNNEKKLGNFSIISETFQRCYLDDPKTENYFFNLINSNETDLTRYIYFYLSYLIENNQLQKAKKLINDIDYLDTSLLLSQGKNWIENGSSEKFNQVFSCKNQNDLIAEFLFLISNLYSSQDNFTKSNFYLNISYYLNPKFIYNLSLVEKSLFQPDFKKTKKILKKFKREDIFYYWFRLKKEIKL